MNSIRLSAHAVEDLFGIATYTRNTWGEEQMEKYIDVLDQCTLRLAASPKLGRLCDEIHAGLRRFEKAEHVIYYRQKDYGIRILRVLHRSMNPIRHEFEDEPADSPNTDSSNLD